MFTITRSQGTWGDVFVGPNGQIGFVYDNVNDVTIEYFTQVNGEYTTYLSGIIPFTEKVLFVRAEQNSAGQVVVMGQGQISGMFLIKALTGQIHSPVVSTYGTQPCDIEVMSNGEFRYVVQVNGSTYYQYPDNQYFPIPDVIQGTSQGIIQILDGQVYWSDLNRSNIPEMLYPFYTSGIHVGEGAVDPPHIQALEVGVQKNIFEGFAQRPRAAYNQSSNIYAVASRGSNGVTFNFYNLPLSDVNEPIPPIPPMSCTPVVPPQDVIATSCNNIRAFCQSYQFGDVKPYVNDEIHENGLFLADGITYFMMSDTGKWAQILMNPDDTRPWDQKRTDAENALFKYMKERVGDFT